MRAFRLAFLLVCGVVVQGVARDRVIPMLLDRPDGNKPQHNVLSCRMQLPKVPAQAVWVAKSPADWLEADRLRFSVVWPEGGPTNVQALVWLIDRDDRWYQFLVDTNIAPGTGSYEIPLTPGEPGWQGVGHAAPWHFRTRLNPKQAGVRFFGNEAFTGSCVLVSADLVSSETTPGAPVITNLRPNARSVPRRGLFELRFDLPDRYADPFDPAMVDVTADVAAPDGAITRVTGFYYQDHYRTINSVEERIEPQGRPEWRVRYAPATAGVHTVTLRVRDRWGENTAAPIPFTVRDTATPFSFIRVSAADPRYFETEDGAFFYPIGHNIRSPFDTRMDDQFPWRFRHPTGSSAYNHYFADMHKAGENFAEIWMSAWSLGIEWSPVIRGYHGAGDYRLDNAWDLDHVLEWARASGIRVNLVLNNHGRVSAWCDPEWQDHPYNASRGGWCKDVMEYFTHERSIAMTQRLHRYLVARWGWDSTVFTWELFSELDLAGPSAKQRGCGDPRVIAWHRVMADHLRAIDPNHRLVATHVSGDYTIQNPELCKLPPLDHCAVDAYHNGPPHQIVNLMTETAKFNNPFGKPVLITEFGGSPMAAGAEHLRQEHHAALWSATASPIAGTPLFWWWHVIDELDLYPVYSAVQRFMKDVDKRDPRMVLVQPTLKADDTPGKPPQPPVEAVCSASPTQAIGWIFTRAGFSGVRESGGAPLKLDITNLAVELGGFTPDQVYRIEIADTASGQTVKRFDLRATGGTLIFQVPSFTRDCAFKIRQP